MARRVSPPRIASYVAVYLLLAGVVAAMGYRSYRLQDSMLDAQWRRDLDALAGVVSSRVQEWRRERIGDAVVAAAAARAMRLDGLMPGAGVATDHGAVRAWLESLRTSYGYVAVGMADRTGLRVLVGDDRDGALATGVASATRNGDPHLDDRVGSDGQPRFSITTQIGPDLLLGLLIDPQATLTPLSLAAYPDAAAYLVVTDERAAWRVFGAPGRETSPADQRAALGAVAATDRLADGDDVLAAARPVGGTAWFVTATRSRAAAFAALPQTRARLIDIASTLLVLLAIVAALMWRQQRSVYLAQQHEAEIEQRALRGHYEFLTRFGNDAIVLLDSEGGIVEVNDRAMAAFGYSRTELRSMRIHDLRVDPQGAASIFEQLRDRGSVVFDADYRAKDGAVLPLEVSARRIEADGREYFQSIMRDISERRKATEEIRHLNRLYAVLSACSRSMVESRTEADLFARVCRIASTVGGFKAAAVSVHDAATDQLTHAARAGDADGYFDRIALAASGPLSRGPAGRSFHSGEPVICHDIGTDPLMEPWREAAAGFGLRSSIALPLRKHGRPIGVLGLYSGERAFFSEAEAKLALEVADSVSFALDSLERDQQRHHAETELRASRNRLERVLDTIDQGYWDWRPRTGELHVNARFHSILGYVPGEIPFGREAALELTHPDDRAAFDAAVSSLGERRDTAFKCEHRMRCKSGEYIWIESRGRVIEWDADGTPSRMIGTRTDVTERRRLEEQFVQAQKLESVGRLAGGVAHDFNNLLTVINGYSEMVLRRLAIGDPNWPHVDAIRDAGMRAAALTQQLLAFSRRQPSQPAVISLNGAVNEFGRLLQRLVGERIAITLRLDASEDLVFVDPAQLQQVILNLVVNARDAMPDGGSLFVHSTNASLQKGDDPAQPPGDYVVLSVTDTGVGMDDATQAHIFEPFFTTKERSKGTGLGLSMVYGVVSQSGGFITVSSTPGRGTTFAIHLPRCTDPLESVATVPRTTRQGTEVVLVVEDEETVRDVAVEMLEALGHTVLSAAHGEAAIRCVENHAGPIDVVLTDIVLPGLNGRAVAERLRVLRPSIKVILASGYADDSIADSGAREPGTVYLQKPYTFDALSAALGESLRARVIPNPAAHHRSTILVADDEAGVRSLFEECLGTDHRVVLAADGIEAVDIVRRDPALDLVIVDVFMPRREGIETIQAIRELRPDLPIIAMSGAFGGKFLEAAERAHVNATLLKPIPLDVLRDTVTRVLGSREASRS